MRAPEACADLIDLRTGRRGDLAVAETAVPQRQELSGAAGHTREDRPDLACALALEGRVLRIADGVARSTDLAAFDPIRLRPLDPSLLRSS